MSNTVFIEDIFINFFDSVYATDFSFDQQDRSAAISFYNTLVSGNKITANQSQYILRILNKYKNIAAHLGVNYTDALTDPQWKNDFRVIDMSRKAWIEIDAERHIWICLKFPYQLKSEFEDEFGKSDESIWSVSYDNVWDKDRRIRMLSLFEYNLIQVHEFCKKHRFTFEESFYEALAQVEQIWQEQDNIKCKSVIEDNEVKLVNANNDTIDYFNKHKIGNIDNDLLLAKSLNYRFKEEPANKVQKIAGAKTNTFYVSNYTDLFDITEKIDGKIAIILDRSADAQNWLETLSKYIDTSNLNRNLFKVCFRESNKENPEFNQWVKDNGFGGKVNEGKYLIFKHKPSKWLFSDNNDVKIIITNNIYVTTNTLTKRWFETHPCVIYFGDVVPSLRSNEFVSL
jgi:hypothetical protein